MSHKNGSSATRACAAVAAMFAALSSHAQSSSTESAAAPTNQQQRVEITGSSQRGGNYQPPVTVGSTKSATPLLETPMSVQVLPRELLVDQQAFTLKEAVKNVSGVVQAAYDYYDFLQIRGFNNGSANYRNGLQVPNATAVDLAFVERVEVVKGPASMLYGRVEPGGLVNRVMKQPLAQMAVNGQLQFGQYGLRRGTADATGKISDDGTLLYRMVGAVTRQDSFQDHVKRSSDAGYGALTWKPNSRFELNLNLELQNTRFVDTEDIGIPVIGNRPANVPRHSFFGDPVNWELPNNHRRKLLGLDWTYTINDQWKLTQRLHLDHRDEQQLTLWFNGFDGVSVLDRGLWFVQNKRRGIATNLDLTGDITLAGMRHRVLVGADAFRFRTEWHGFSDVTAEVPSIDIFAPSYGISADALRALPENFFYATRDQWTGLYAQDQISLTDRWQLLVGGRYDEARTGNGFSGTNLAEARSAVVLEKDHAFSPRLGLLHQLTPQTSIYASYAKSFGANNGRTATGERIDPQQAQQIEFGAKHLSADGRLNVTASLFRLTKTNELTADLSTPDPSDQVAIGEVRSQGLELDVLGQVTRNLNLIATYTLTASEITRNNDGTQGNDLPNVPRHAASLWAKFDTAPGAATGWEAGAGIYLRSQRQGDRANSYQLPGYARVDAMLRHRLLLGGRKVSAQLNVENLFDRTYFDRAGVAGPVAKYGNPRTVTATLSLDL
jgi:iron complex outermembrane recepter protein